MYTHEISPTSDEKYQRDILHFVSHKYERFETFAEMPRKLVSCFEIGSLRFSPRDD